MPWGKIDDSLYDHPKLDKLGRQRMPCLGLWTVAISWCNRRLTDGEVPSDRVRLLGGTIAQAELLVEAGLFDRIEGGYQVHDFLHFNDSRDDVLARRAAAAERQRKVRSSHGESQRDSQQQSQRDFTRSHSTPQAPAIAPDRARPVPSRPLPKPPIGSTRLNTPRATNGEPLLTKDQLDEWARFGDEWQDVKDAWLARGLLFPPSGNPEGDDSSQRGLLWAILDARPTDLPRWIREAPGKTAHEVIGHVIDRWHTIRDEAEATEPAIAVHGPNRRAAPERFGAVMERVVHRREGSAA